MSPGLLAIDAGQSSVTARMFDSEDVIELPGVMTDAALLPQLASAAAAASAVLGPVRSVAVGTTGLTATESDPNVLLRLLQPVGVTSVHLAHDSITSYLGAVSDVRGAVVAAGTGVVTLGVGARSLARVDGWGNLFGDAGSAYWIGRAALDAVMRAFDGRGPETALTDRVREEFADLPSAYMELQADPGRVRRVAAYSRVVDELADDDAVARAICVAAAGELVTSVRAALEQVGEATNPSPRVCAIGGVLRSRWVSEAFEEGIRSLWPGVDLAPARGVGLDGAAALFSLGPDSSLYDAVSRATTVVAAVAAP